ncbi:MAG TPA: hypothetical protein VKO20_00155 [Desulfosalsimonadaceae bacterium]|nr:hypothetical protein [Desulfosalsimonadaceae bacterium]
MPVEVVFARRPKSLPNFGGNVQENFCTACCAMHLPLKLRKKTPLQQIYCPAINLFQPTDFFSLLILSKGGAASGQNINNMPILMQILQFLIDWRGAAFLGMDVATAL